MEQEFKYLLYVEEYDVIRKSIKIISGRVSKDFDMVHAHQHFTNF